MGFPEELQKQYEDAQVAITDASKQGVEAEEAERAKHADLIAERDQAIRDWKTSQIPLQVRSDHAYCSMCGATMRAFRFRIAAFDPKTGEKSQEERFAWACPLGHETF